MKKLYLSITGIFCALIMIAQPTLDYPQNAPAIGDIMAIQFVSCEGLTQGPAGPDVTWDFSELTNTWEPGLITVISPADAPAGNDFPDANIVMNMNDTIFTYAKTDATGIYYLGSQITTAMIPVLFKYSDIRTYLEFPFTYGDAFTDTYEGVSTAMMTEIRLSASSSVTADAYGTLLLPNGTFTNVLRTLTTDVEIDSIFVKGMFVSTMTTNRTQYHWFAPDSKGPLFSMEVSDCSGDCDTTCYYTMQESIIGEAPAGSISELSIFPNPADEYVVVELNSFANAEIAVSIVNQVGQLVQTRTLTASVQSRINEKFEISDLPPGIYFVNVNCDCGKQLTNKFVVR